MQTKFIVSGKKKGGKIQPLFFFGFRIRGGRKGQTRTRNDGEEGKTKKKRGGREGGNGRYNATPIGYFPAFREKGGKRGEVLKKLHSSNPREM